MDFKLSWPIFLGALESVEFFHLKGLDLKPLCDLLDVTKACAQSLLNSKSKANG